MINTVWVDDSSFLVIDWT